MKLRIDGKEFSLRIKQTQKGPAICIDGRKISTGPKKGIYNSGRKSYIMSVAKKADGSYRITTLQDSYTAEIEETKNHFMSKIRAPMQGMITSIEVKKGQEVKRGQTLARLMAMKMENEIKAEADCRVKSVSIKNRQRVAKGETIIELEKENEMQ